MLKGQFEGGLYKTEWMNDWLNEGTPRTNGRMIIIILTFEMESKVGIKDDIMFLLLLHCDCDKWNNYYLVRIRAFV